MATEGMCAHVPAGWLNVLGQFATTAFAGFFLAQHLAAMWLLSNGHSFSPEELLLAYASAHPLPLLLGNLSYAPCSTCYS